MIETINMAAPMKKKFVIPTIREMVETKHNNVQSSFIQHQSEKQATIDATHNVNKNDNNIKTDINMVSSNSNSSAKPSVKQPAPLTSVPTVIPRVIPSKTAIDSQLQANTLSNNTKNEGTSNTESFPTLAKIGNTNCVIVNPRQRGNPLLKHIRNIPWEYGNIIPDYVMGQATCALFLSLRYHQLHHNYIHERLKSLGRSFDLRVLLVQVDLADPHHLLKELSKICILADCTLILAFSAEEAGRYLETYKIFENKSPESIMEKTDGNFMTKLTDCFTSVKSVNKTDCATLLSSFKTVENIINADKEDLGLCPGFGPQKAKRLYDVLHEPFLKIKKHQPKKSTSEKEAQPSSSSFHTDQKHSC